MFIRDQAPPGSGPSRPYSSELWVAGTLSDISWVNHRGRYLNQMQMKPKMCSELVLLPSLREKLVGSISGSVSDAARSGDVTELI